MLAGLRRRGITLPSLPRTLATVTFETWAAQVRERGRRLVGTNARHRADAAPLATLPFAAQHLFFAPVKQAGVIDSVVHNVGAALAGLARTLAGALRMQAS